MGTTITRKYYNNNCNNNNNNKDNNKSQHAVISLKSDLGLSERSKPVFISLRNSADASCSAASTTAPPAFPSSPSFFSSSPSSSSFSLYWTVCGLLV